MRFYFAGQTNFGNRGCEALVRSIVGIVRDTYPESRFYCPSTLPFMDIKQWPSANVNGVEFSQAPDFPEALRWWARGCRIIPGLESFMRPRFGSYSNCNSEIRASSAMIFTGGDIFGLEYGVSSLFHWANFADVCIDSGLPSILWGASVGPFTSKPAVEKEMVKHLSRYSAITVRETSTLEYLQSLGIRDAQLVADPAFTEREAVKGNTR